MNNNNINNNSGNVWRKRRQIYEGRREKKQREGEGKRKITKHS